MIEQNEKENSFFEKLKKLVNRQKFRRKAPDSVPFSQTGPGKFSGHVFGGANRVAMSIYEQNLQANADRTGRLRDYDLMDTTPIVSSALNIYSDDSCSLDEYGKVLTIESDNEKIKNELEFLFNDIINLEFNMYHWTRNLVKYGDTFLLMAIEPERGVQGVINLPTSEIEREEAFDGDPNSIRFRWLSQVGEYYEDYQIAHMRLVGDDNFLPYGRSVLEAGRRSWKQVQLLEDAMLTYRVARAAEKRVFHIEVGNLPPEEVGKYLQEQRDRIKTESLVNPMTGELDLRYRSTAITDDFWFAKRGEMMSTVETLPGGARLNDIEDVTYVTQQLITSLGVPKIYLQFDEDLGSRSSASKEDIRFARTIQRIQKIIISELNKIAILHLFALKKFEESELSNFDLKLYNPSTIMELGKLELIEKRLDIFAKAINDPQAYSQFKAKTEILHMSDIEIEEEEKRILKDKKQVSETQNITDDISSEGGNFMEQEPSGNEDNSEKSEIEKELEVDKEEFDQEPNIGRNNSIKQNDPTEFQTKKKSDFKFENNLYLNKNAKDLLIKNLGKKNSKLMDFFQI